MLIKFYKIFCLTLLLIFQSPLYSKSKDIKEFNYKNLSSYLSGLVSYDNQKNIDSLKFFTLSDSLPILFLAFSIAFFDISKTVILLYPFDNR